MESIPNSGLLSAAEIDVRGSLDEEPKQRTRIGSLLAASYLFRNCPTPLLTSIASQARLLDLVAGDSLWHEGDRATSFHVINCGLVSIQRTLASGATTIQGIFGGRESVGDTAALLVDGTYPMDAVAMTREVSVVRLSAVVVRAAIRRCPELAASLQASLLRHCAELRAKVDILSAGSVGARLALLFLHLAARFGDQADDGSLVVPLALSRTMLASLVSARPETVVRAMQPWQRAGIVETSRRGFVIHDRLRLRDLANEG